MGLRRLAEIAEPRAPRLKIERLHCPSWSPEGTHLECWTPLRSSVRDVCERLNSEKHEKLKTIEKGSIIRNRNGTQIACD